MEAALEEQLLLERTGDSVKIVSESDMKRTTFKRVALFIGMVAAVAAIIYLSRHAREKRQAQEVLQQQRAAEIEAAAHSAAKHTAARAEYMARYLSPGFARKRGLKNVAIAAASEDGNADRPVAAALAARLKDENLVLFTSFFKPAFFADGLFSNIFAGSLECVDELELTNTLDALLLAQERVRYLTNGVGLNHVITADTRLEVAFYPLDMMRREQTWTFTTNGVGSSPDEARVNAKKRLLKQIANDTKMSLVPLSQDDQDTYP